ncbi:hypothetical protein BCR35DRAFT_307337 [Leucosporidium creatinivorum]|uniref:Uncharacterized protein n=1 Tax=Leucosporidium creatinivorum TaxID=106004 RepID=A0A1Y2EP70_9BASI|nr:hypothetical protein BCR35DRAFT_307337 [Leucosporidium creatinivorum]
MQTISPQSSTDSTSSIEIGDFLFCQHGTERCETCNADFREDNAFTAGLDPIESREALKVDFTLNAKDGMPQCKNHKSADCTKCFAFKKQIVKLNKEAEKMKKKQPKSTSNFV